MESMFINRVKKNYLFLKKWSKRENITAFRIYDKDIPQYPFAVDFYSGAIVLYQYERSKNNSELSNEYEIADLLQLEEVISDLKKYFVLNENDFFLKVRKKQKGLSQYERENEKGVTRVVNEGDMKFLVNLSDYLDCGLFLDHRKTRQIVKKLSFDKNVLNLFAYTGSVSVAAALGNAKSVTTVDMSNTYLKWAESNFKLNNISNSNNEFIRANIVEWLDNLTINSKKFDLIFVDPPSFSNSKKMSESFDIQRDYISLLKNCEKILSEKGTIIFSNNLRSFKFDNEEFLKSFNIENITKKTLPQDFRNEKIHQAWLLNKK
jgi:23S rRNA (guanine2445-N2)-methyltransferase / 23S rRNA (guanine2069-N7)-methyltransferase